MEILRKTCLFILFLWVSYTHGSQLFENKGYSDIESAIASPKSTNYLVVYGNDNSINLLKENIQLFEHLRGIVIVGEVKNPENLWSALSNLSLIEYLFFLDNNLGEIKIGGTTSTLKYLWIRNSPSMDSKSINAFLTRSNLIQSLRFSGVNFKLLPMSIQNMPLLEELQISNSNLSSKEVFKVLNKENKLKRLILTDNNFQFFSKGLKKVKDLKVLDLSSNNFSGKVKHLEKLSDLDTLVLNRNSYENHIELAQQIQKTNSNWLLLDNTSDKNEKKLEYLLPGTQLTWSGKLKSFSDFNLPSFQEKEETTTTVIEEGSELSNRLQSFYRKGNAQLLSEAYLEYEKFVIPQPLREFDTTRYNNRYMDSSYFYMQKIKIQNHTKEGRRHKLKYSKYYGGVKKKKGTVKINHTEDSHIQFEIFEEKECNDGLVVSMNIGQIEGNRRTILNPFKQFVWFVSTENEQTFESKYINQKSWSDVRVNFENNEFSILLKGRFEDETLDVEPRFKRDPNITKSLDKSAKKAYERYLDGLKKEELRYNKGLTKEEKKLIRPYKRDIEKAWTQISSKMSNEEKLLSRSEWLEYYEEVKKDEFALLPEQQISLGYLSRFLVGQGFKQKRSNDFYVGQKWVNASVLYNNDTLNLSELCIIDLDQNMVANQQLVKNKILLEPFHELLIYGLSEEGLFFKLTKTQIEKVFKNETVFLNEKLILNKKLSTLQFYEAEVKPNL